MSTVERIRCRVFPFPGGDVEYVHADALTDQGPGDRQPDPAAPRSRPRSVPPDSGNRPWPPHSLTCNNVSKYPIAFLSSRSRRGNRIMGLRLRQLR